MTVDGMPEWHRSICQNWFSIANGADNVRQVNEYQPYQKVGDQIFLRNLVPVLTVKMLSGPYRKKMRCPICDGDSDIFEEGNCNHKKGDHNLVDIPEHHSKYRMIMKVSMILQKASNCVLTVNEGEDLKYANLSSRILKGSEFKRLVRDIYFYINQLASKKGVTGLGAPDADNLPKIKAICSDTEDPTEPQETPVGKPAKKSTSYDVEERRRLGSTPFETLELLIRKQN